MLAATEAFGCRSSKDSENTFISVPVADLNAATIALNASSSAGTKRFQRITVSLAPGFRLPRRIRRPGLGEIEQRLAGQRGAGRERGAALKQTAAGEIMHRRLSLW